MFSLRKTGTHDRRSDDRLALALPLMEQGIWDWNVSEDRFYVDEQWTHMHGMPPKAVDANLDFKKSLVHPDDRESVVRALIDHLEGRSPLFESEHRECSTSGDWIWVRDRGRVVEKSRDGGALRVVGVQQDISESRSETAALRESEAELRRVIDNVPAMTAYVDAELRLRLWSRSFAEFNCRDPEELYGMHGRDFAGEAGWKIIEPYLLQALSGKTANYGREMHFADGRRRWVEVTLVPRILDDGTVLGVYVMSLDITDKKEAERALREREEQLSAIVNNAPFWVFLKDRDRRYLLLNRLRPGEKEGRRSPDDFIGKRYEDFPHDNAFLAETVRREDLEVIESGRTLKFESEIVDPDGVARAYSLTKFPIKEESGKVVGLGGIQIDVTDTLRAERERQEALSKFNVALDTIDQGWLLVNRDLKLVAANKHYTAMLGLPENTVKPGIGIAELILMLAQRGMYGPGDPKALAEARLASLLAGDTQAKSSVFWLEGRHIQVRSHLLPEGGLVVVLADVTEELFTARKDELLRKAFDQMPEAVLVFDSDAKVLFANKAYQELFPYMPPLNERVGMPFLELIERTMAQPGLITDPMLDEDREAYIAMRVERFHNPPEGPFEVLHGDRLLRIHETLIAGVGNISVLQDITEERRVLEALRRNEREISLVMDNVPALIASLDADGRYITVNKRYADAFGKPRDAFIGNRPSDVLDEDVPARITPYTERALAGETVAFEERVRLKGSEARWLSVNYVPAFLEDGTPDGFYAMVVDITERKRAARKDRLVKEAVDQMTQALLLFDGDDRLLFANKAYQDLFTYMPNLDERAGMPFRELVQIAMNQPGLVSDPLLQQDPEAYFRKRLERQHNPPSTPFESYHGDRLLRMQEKLVPEVGHIKLIDDITEERGKEEELRRLNQDLEGLVNERTQQLEAANQELESFAYTVSHDLRAPLRSMDGFSQAVLEDYGPAIDATGKNYLERIRNASQRMSDLIDGLLDLSRVNRGQLNRKTVDLSKLARAAIADLKRGHPDQTATVSIQDSVVDFGDETLIQILFQNLLGNAWKFSSKSEAPKIEFGATREDGHPVYYVRDNGVGFDPAYVDKLFKPFQRLHSDADFQGTGIGLATVARIVARHGGTVRAESEVGKGATILFTLGSAKEE